MGGIEQIKKLVKYFCRRVIIIKDALKVIGIIKWKNILNLRICEPLMKKNNFNFMKTSPLD